MRSGSSCPWGAVNWRIMLASLIGWHCATSCQWPLALCQWASGFGRAGLRGSPSSESSGVVFLLVGVPALCAVHLCVPVHWRWRRQRPAQFGGFEDHHIRRRRRRHWRRSVGRRRLGFQRQGCVAARAVRLDSGSAAAEALAALAGLSLTNFSDRSTFVLLS